MDRGSPAWRWTLLSLAALGIGTVVLLASPAAGSTAAPVGGDAISTPDAVGSPLDVDRVTASHGDPAVRRSSPAAAPERSGGVGRPGSVQSNATIVERVSYRLVPGDADRVEATIAYSIPAGTDRLSVSIVGGEYDVVDVEGFRANGSESFEWDGSEGGGTVTIRHDVTESFREEAPDEQFTGGEASWAIVSRPQTSTRWCCSGAARGLTYEFTVEGEGRAGDRLALLGSHETVSRTVDGESIVLAVPAAATASMDREAVLEAVAHASDRLRWGSRNDEVLLIAAPSSDVEWSPRGLTVGSDARIAADASADGRTDVWVHEYVHTRQYRDAEIAGEDAVAADVRWLVEGSAEYYAAALALEAGRTDREEFRSLLQRGRDPHVADAVLAESDTWETTDAQYLKGALVVAALDGELRSASGGAATFQDVMAEWTVAQTFTAADFEAALADHGGPTVRGRGREWTRTSAVPRVPGDDAIDQLLDQPTARFSIRTADEPPIAVGGPYRAGPLPDDLVLGETISTRLVVENVGDARGTYRGRLTLGGRTVASERGALDPGERATVDLDHTVNRTGDQRIVAGNVARTVSVEEPASPTVTRLTASAGELTLGESTTVTATVGNPAPRPAVGNVTIAVDGRPVTTEEVHVAPRSNATVQATTTFEETGERAVTADGLAVTVQVSAEPELFERARPLAIPVAVVAGVILLAGVAVLRRRTRA